jgi:hypothetical protein
MIHGVGTLAVVPLFAFVVLECSCRTNSSTDSPKQDTKIAASPTKPMEYKVVSLRNRGASRESDASLLDRVINEYARQGWMLKQVEAMSGVCIFERQANPSNDPLGIR